MASDSPKHGGSGCGHHDCLYPATRRTYSPTGSLSEFFVQKGLGRRVSARPDGHGPAARGSGVKLTAVNSVTSQPWVAGKPSCFGSALAALVLYDYVVRKGRQTGKQRGMIGQPSHRRVGEDQVGRGSGCYSSIAASAKSAKGRARPAISTTGSRLPASPIVAPGAGNTLRSEDSPGHQLSLHSRSLLMRGNQ